MEGVIDSKTKRWLFVYLSNLDECRKDVSPIFVGDFIYEALWESPSQLPLRKFRAEIHIGSVGCKAGPVYACYIWESLIWNFLYNVQNLVAHKDIMIIEMNQDHIIHS